MSQSKTAIIWHNPDETPLSIKWSREGWADLGEYLVHGNENAPYWVRAYGKQILNVIASLEDAEDDD